MFSMFHFDFLGSLSLLSVRAQIHRPLACTNCVALATIHRQLEREQASQSVARGRKCVKFHLITSERCLRRNGTLNSSAESFDFDLRIVRFDVIYVWLGLIFYCDCLAATADWVAGWTISGSRSLVAITWQLFFLCLLLWWKGGGGNGVYKMRWAERLSSVIRPNQTVLNVITDIFV